jgi:hypothetical protein
MMSWPCRLIEYTKEVNGKTLQVGDMFFYTPPEGYDVDKDEDGWDWPGHFCRQEVLSGYYKANNSHRPPLFVFLPGRTLFCVDGACWRAGSDNKIEYYGGWSVTGEAPVITMSPSINIVGSYHGFLQNGVISEDCEGRRYDESGRQVR